MTRLEQYLSPGFRRHTGSSSVRQEDSPDVDLVEPVNNGCDEISCPKRRFIQRMKLIDMGEKDSSP